MEILRLEKINKVFGNKDTSVKALKDVNIKIKSGELVAIMGSSGSGKSTLLNIIGTLEKPSSGKFYFKGEDISQNSEDKISKFRNKVFGFVVQHFALVKDFTVYENVEIPLAYNKDIKKKEYLSKIEDVLIKLNIREKMNSKPNELSGGQCQRVAIARALVNNAEIILADEPTGALDNKTSRDVMRLFKELNKEGKTIIIVTHDEKIANECNRIIRIEDGEIVNEEV